MLVGVGISAFALALAAKDAVVMTVNGKDVPKSEFEYLYHKNSQQQMSAQPIDDYAELFKLYKLKVEDARAEGLDTMQNFKKEMEQYRHDLAAPYLADSTYMYQLLDEAAKRAQEEVEARHIMIFKSRDASQNPALRQRADSLLSVLKNGGDFEELAKQYSGDRGSNSRGGLMGYITALQYPYEFETAAYTLADGEISEVVESPMGYHILKGGKHRPASGEVLAEHILILTQGKNADQEVAAKATIDSLYNIVKKDPSQFEDLARRFSDDKGSGREGGKLPWFGRGRMVAEFDSTAFALKDGEISEPFKTSYGYHIIYKLDHKGAPSAKELKPKFLNIIASDQDPRSRMIRNHQSETLAKKNKGKLNAATVEALKKDASQTGLNDAFYAKWNGNAADFAIIGKKKYPVSGFISYLGKRQNPDPASSAQALAQLIDSYYNTILVENEEENLLLSKPEYANLYKEYVDGSLLYEVSVKKVWDKAAKDEEGLKNYFESHRDKYSWTMPRAKGYLVQASTDSVAELVKRRAAEIGRDSLVNTIRKEFPKEVSIMKVLEPKGSNAMIDNLVFGGPEATPSSPRYTVYFMLDPRVISMPEELQDVRGAVTSDYQTLLQEEWEKELLSKYPVKVNEKVLKSVNPTKKK